jgi:hypothetical protein
MRKRLICTTAMVALLATVAGAADLYRNPPPYAPAPPAA